ncbi:MAG: hypothetical protein LQ352_004164 [Teloschistes flavicans]|nr:MAG: hypothetical protein LQ352_004164 [Teloschistes flavicans]
MSVRIVLDNNQPTLYTNLDFITGKAILSLRNHETIAAITVKLEGESKSRLIGDLQLPVAYGAGFHRRREDMTLETEVHKSTVVNIAGLQMQAPGNTDRHVRQTLPPSLHPFQDQAVIRYFLKATVQRAAFYKENFRTVIGPTLQVLMRWPKASTS